jgi:hypothetical protein
MHHSSSWQQLRLMIPCLLALVVEDTDEAEYVPKFAPSAEQGHENNHGEFLRCIYGEDLYFCISTHRSAVTAIRASEVWYGS